jgi:hypothetical protein
MRRLDAFTRTAASALAATMCLALAVAGWCQDDATQAHGPSSSALHIGFENSEPSWIDEGGDAKRLVRLHERTSSSAHSGQYSERIGVTATGGTHLHYSYPIGRAPVEDDLRVSVWIKADRPGIQLLVRAVFPRERDPNTLQLLHTLVPGTIYDQPGKWQRLELTQPDVATERQARLLRASLGRNVDTREAYADHVLLNVYAGPGDTDLNIDDLEVSPVVFEAVPAAGATLGPPGESPGPSVLISQDRLLVEGRPRLLRAVRAPGVSGETLKEFGFNAVAASWPPDLAALEEAVRSGLWLMPQLPAGTDAAGAGERSPAKLIENFPFRDAVLCWYLTSSGEPSPVEQIAEPLRKLRSAPPRRPVAGDVADDFRAFSRELDMIGAHRWPVGTAMGIRQYREWLTQRRYLARPGTYFFTWVQATTEGPDGVAAAWGPEPDQIRLLTYAALAAGYRGVGFWADRTLGQPGHGRRALLQLGLLNLELQLLEPYFASAGSVETVTVEVAAPLVKQGPGADTSLVRGDFGRKRGVVGGFSSRPKPRPLPTDDREEVQATRVGSDRGLVVIPVWYGKGAQFVPGQLATNDLTLVIPGIPEAAQAWQVTPADVRLLKRERVGSGTRLTLPEFDLTAVVLLTSDTTLLAQLRREVARTRSWAALWASELAVAELDHLKHANARLVAMGRAQPDGPALLQTAQEHLAGCRGALAKGEYSASFAEAQRAMRAIRILERAHWDDAVKELSTPQASPYAVSFATLPEHWELMREASDGEWNSNLVAGGEFESVEALAADGWTQRLTAGDGLELKATLSAQNPRRGERSLHLEVKPAAGQEPPAVLDSTEATLVSRPIPVVAGDVVRVRFWLRIPAAIRGNVEGAAIYDSIGGPALAVARSEPLEWKQYTLLRRVARTEPMTVTLALTGIGDVYIDDLEVQRLSPRGPTAQRKRPAAVRR